MSINGVRPSETLYVLLKFIPICDITVPFSKYSIWVSMTITWYLTRSPFCSSNEGGSHDNITVYGESVDKITLSGASIGAKDTT